MKKTIFTLAILASVLFASCNSALKDDIDDLEANLTELQTELDEANQIIDDSGIENAKSIEITHEYSYDDGTPILEEITWIGLTYPYYELNDNGDDTYDIYIYIEDYHSSEYTGRIELDIENYDPETGDYYLDEIDFRIDQNIYGENIYIYAYENSSYATTTINMDSFNAETGEISLEAIVEYTEDFSYSEYDTDGTLTIKFDGVLPVKEEEPSSSVIQ